MATNLTNMHSRKNFTFTKHRDGTVSMRCQPSVILNLLDDAARVALEMQVYVGMASDMFPDYQAEEWAWKLLYHQVRHYLDLYYDWDGSPDPRRQLDIDDIQYLHGKLVEYNQAMVG